MSAAFLSEHLLELAVTGVFSLQVWMVRALIEVRADTRASRQTLFGETGTNGINGTVKEHTTELRDTDRRLTRLESHFFDGGSPA
jgi:hypothetical protein